MSRFFLSYKLNKWKYLSKLLKNIWLSERWGFGVLGLMIIEHHREKIETKLQRRIRILGIKELFDAIFADIYFFSRLDSQKKVSKDEDLVKLGVAAGAYLWKN